MKPCNSQITARIEAKGSGSHLPLPFIRSFLQRREIESLSRAACIGDREAVRLLADAAAAPDRVISNKAKECLSSLDNRDAIESACECVLNSENGSLRSICIDNDYFPEDEEIRAVFFMATGQIDRYLDHDIREDRPLLAGGFHRAPEPARMRVLAAARKEGMGAVMADILSRHNFAPQSGYSIREWRALARSLGETCDWRRIWSLAFEAPVPVAVEMLSMLKGACWTADENDAILWKRLSELLPGSWNFPDPSADPSTVLDGPREAVSRLLLHPDGGMLATGSYDGTITLFGLPGGSLLHSISAGCGDIHNLLFSPDGMMLAATGAFSGIRLIDPRDGKILKTIGEGAEAVRHLIFLPDSGSLVHDGKNGSIYLTDVEGNDTMILFAGDGETICALASSPSGDSVFWGTENGLIRSLPVIGGTIVAYAGHRNPVTFIAVTYSGHYLVSVGTSGKIRFWNAGSGTSAGRVGREGMRCTAVAVAAGSDLCAFATDEGEVSVNSLPDGQVVASFEVYKGGVTALEFSPDGSFLVAGGRSGHIHIWENGDGRLIKSQKAHESAVKCLAVTRAGTAAASSGWDGSIKLFSLPEGGLIQSMKVDPAGISSLAAARDGRLIVYGTGNGNVRARSLQDGTLAATFSAYSTCITSIAPDSRGEHIACAARDGTLNIWKLSDGSLVRNLSGNSGTIHSLAMHPGDRVIAGGGWDHSIRLWSFPEGALRSELTGHRSLVTCLGFTHDGAVLCSGSNDRTARIWRTDGESLAVLEGHRHVISCLAISPDDSRLFTGSRDGTVRIWSLPDGRPLACLGPSQSWLSALAVGPDSTILAAGCEDGSLCLWSLPDGDLIKQRHGHMSPVRGLAFTSDGRSLVAGYEDGTVRNWPLPWTKTLIQARPSDLAFVSRQVENGGDGSRSVLRQWEFLEALLKGKFRWAIGHSSCDSRIGPFDIEIME